MLALNIIFMILSILIIIITLLQSGKGSGLGVLAGQNMTEQFIDKKERGPEIILSRVTMVLVILFFTLSIFMHFLLTR